MLVFCKKKNKREREGKNEKRETTETKKKLTIGPKQ